MLARSGVRRPGRRVIHSPFWGTIIPMIE